MHRALHNHQVLSRAEYNSKSNRKLSKKARQREISNLNSNKMRIRNRNLKSRHLETTSWRPSWLKAWKNKVNNKKAPQISQEEKKRSKLKGTLPVRKTAVTRVPENRTPTAIITKALELEKNLPKSKMSSNWRRSKMTPWGCRRHRVMTQPKRQRVRRPGRVMVDKRIRAQQQMVVARIK